MELPGSSSLVLAVAGHVSASRHASRIDFSMTYDNLPNLAFTEIELRGDRWHATHADGTHVERERGRELTFQETGVCFVIDPQAILDQSEVLSEEDCGDGTRQLRLREPQDSIVTTRSGELVDFAKPQARWRHIADDISVFGADSYVAIHDRVNGLVLRWDALNGNRLLRRLELLDVAVTRPST